MMRWKPALNAFAINARHAIAGLVSQLASRCPTIVYMLMATLVSIRGQGAEAQLVSADYRKFAQCELANAWVFDGCQRTSAGAKNWCDRNTAGNVVFGENVVVGEEG